MPRRFAKESSRWRLVKSHYRRALGYNTTSKGYKKQQIDRPQGAPRLVTRIKNPNKRVFGETLIKLRTPRRSSRIRRAPKRLNGGRIFDGANFGNALKLAASVVKKNWPKLALGPRP